MTDPQNPITSNASGTDNPTDTGTGSGSATVGTAPAPVSIFVMLSKNRSKTGLIFIIEDNKLIATPFRVLGKADNAAAAKAGNPDRDSTQVNGDTPTGEYSVPGFIETGEGTDYSDHSYGSNGAFQLTPTSGDALTAADNGRDGLLIHGGDLNDEGLMRPTHGCLRVSNEDMEAIMRTLNGRIPTSAKVIEEDIPPLQDLPPFPEPLEAAPSIGDFDNSGVYVANVHTHEVHKSGNSCSWVHLITDDHKINVDGLPEGYTWCEHCRA